MQDSMSQLKIPGVNVWLLGPIQLLQANVMSLVATANTCQVHSNPSGAIGTHLRSNENFFGAGVHFSMQL